ncbi:VOC family protein [Lipingzhangella sp. LS1_29]|uniref:VOC family protein n=1 Tax=Lipingzhangella rawalii TaxID=2055835 RepID=A0ABU2HCG9_9ACTN|nr:VOC family protein [Lipingzhangella rawalii]MDS1272535.1 VOC family protein [Lipingzhangella rawalii]
MPSFTGIAHLTLSVRDRDASVRFYRDVLGFQEFQTRDCGEWRRTMCRHRSGVVLGLIEHKDHFNAVFDHRRVGVDHLAFTVSSSAELDAWEERLTELDIDHSPVVHAEQGRALTFADPDGFQLELYCEDSA